MKNIINISVRHLVEHVFLSGNIEQGMQFVSNLTEGTRIHQQVQKGFDETSEKEVYVKTDIEYEDVHFFIYGRIDGLHFQKEEIIIEEIKSTSLRLEDITEEMNPGYCAQAYLYGYIFAKDHQLQHISIKLTYVQKQTNEMKSFVQIKSFSELERFVFDCLKKYAPFARLQFKNKLKRNQTSKELSFPFAQYRKGQRELAGCVYQSIRDKATLFVEAPTGIGKTISTTFPAVKAIGENIAERIIYTTARGTTRQQAESAFQLMEQKGLNIRAVSITAKEKICFKDQTICNPEYCEFAKGHYDRLNEGLIDLLENETVITQDIIEQYAKKHRLCPFEFSLDAAYLADCIICDYNYIFDPQVSLNRLYEEKKKETVLLVDEAHNLVDRARDMYSASIYKSNFLNLKREYKSNPSLFETTKNINNYFLQLKKQMDGTDQILKSLPDELIELLKEFAEVTESSLKQNNDNSSADLLKDAYYEVQKFLKMAKLFDEHFVALIEVIRSEVKIKIFCLDPSALLKQYGKNYGSKIFFSATLSPIQYYKDMLGGSVEDNHISLPSPFSKEQTDVYIYPLSTRYREREQTSMHIALMLANLIEERTGNYFIFFPSYKYMNIVYEEFLEECPKVPTIVQKPGMTEEERGTFLATFDEKNNESLIGFAVMGGIFSEGIDLVGNRLNGVIIVGVGLPQIGLERNIIKDYFNNIGKNGYDYAYVYPGLNKVLQAGGRLIRTEHDQGTIILVDDRFLTKKYLQLLPSPWKDFKIIK